MTRGTEGVAPLRQLDRGLLWAIVSFMLIQAGASIWWASKLTDRVEHLETSDRAREDDHTKIAVMAAQTDYTARAVQQLTGERIATADQAHH